MKHDRRTDTRGYTIKHLRYLQITKLVLEHANGRWSLTKLPVAPGAAGGFRQWGAAIPSLYERRVGSGKNNEFHGFEKSCVPARHNRHLILILFRCTDIVLSNQRITFKHYTILIIKQISVDDDQYIRHVSLSVPSFLR